jgi:hypothetical protein
MTQEQPRVFAHNFLEQVPVWDLAGDYVEEIDALVERYGRDVPSASEPFGFWNEQILRDRIVVQRMQDPGPGLESGIVIPDNSPERPEQGVAGPGNSTQTGTSRVTNQPNGLQDNDDED